MAVAEEKNILVTSGSDRATPIAVVPFALQGGSVLPEDMADIIGNDLRNSGYYAPIPRQNMISQPSQASEVIFRDWKALGAQYVMVGSIVPAGGRLQVQYALFNVATEQQVLTGSVSGTTDQLRDMSHYIADQSFEKLTGIKGAFSTRMLYVTAERFSKDNTRYTLQRSDYDGARAVTLLQSREPILSPRFAPDGKRIAYVSFEQRRPRIFVQHIDTGRREQITNFEGLNGAPAWSPDGSRLAFVLSKDGNPDIYVMNMASRQMSRVTAGPGINTEPFWGKDGSTIYFTSDRGGKPQIYKTNVSGGGAERVTFVGNYNANPKLSADEKTLVMIHRQQGFTNFKVAAQDLQRGSVKILSDRRSLPALPRPMPCRRGRS
ncbi:Tol-Pal system beta propeller repeat protein TolB, partial [Pseudomonas qingdaonensis]|uniref:Tol-Pal system beta propeller repeat protein TolB n=1 Tax=Pseudomonas qingdaonensis TaxID=2056231 RepID=UPI003CFE50EE